MGNPIKHIFLNFTSSGRTYDNECFKYDSLECVYFVCPSVLSAFW